ncbi:major facilitator transporter [Burkholderia cepacia]|nr:major facilitator transporter [Burkholderia cepacia]
MPARETASSDARGDRFVKQIARVATLGGLLFGYDTGVINGAITYMQRDLALTPLLEGMVASFLLLGAATGAVFGGRFADSGGRRKNILMLAILFLVGALACAAAPNVPALIASRFVLGLAVGGASVSVPTYLAEIAPAERRGQIVTRNELMIVIGQLLAFACNAVIGSTWGADHGVWRWMLVVATLPAVLLWFGMLSMPESPRWLASKGRMTDALRVLEQVREKQRAKSELEDIRRVNVRDNVERGGWADLATPWMRRAFLVGTGIAVVQQATGVNSIMYYGTQILTSSGFGAQTALIANVANGVISVVAVLIGIALLGRLGRRTMFLTGLSGTTLSLLAIGMFSVLLPFSATRAYLILSAMVMFLAFMQMFIAPVSWVMLAEIFPLKLRGFGFGFAGCVLWIVNFAISLVFPVFVAHAGISSTFFVFFLFGICSLVFVARYVPETRGRSLEEIEATLRAKYTGAHH